MNKLSHAIGTTVKFTFKDEEGQVKEIVGVINGCMIMDSGLGYWIDEFGIPVPHSEVEFVSEPTEETIAQAIETVDAEGEEFDDGEDEDEDGTIDEEDEDEDNE